MIGAMTQMFAGMGWLGGIAAILVVVALVLAAAALLKVPVRRAAKGGWLMSESAPTLERRASATSGRLMLALPALVFIALAVAFAFGLTRNPHDIPSVLIGRQVPQFNLPPVKGRTLGLSSENLTGEVSLVNVFASWCVACRYEHPFFIQLKAQGIVPIHGIDYKDKPDDAAEWLDTMGDPYTRTGADIDGRVAIDWGVTGVPETFVIDRQGRIAYKQIGPIDREVLDETILPLIERLRQ